LKARKFATFAVLFMAVLSASPAAAQTDKQMWGALTLDWIRSHTLTLSVDVEPKVLVSHSPPDPGWSTLDVTPKAEFVRGKWFDLVSELHLGQTQQTDQQDSWEVTPRIGFRFHVLSNVVDDLRNERQPRRRLVLRNVVRVESRNLYYSDSTPQSSTVRYRDRVETLFPVNRPRITNDGVVYGSADVEWFWSPQGVPERFANKQRVRACVGYRWNYAWRLETLLVWDRSRDSAENAFSTVDAALDVRLRRVW